ncbi:MAG: hypothetical protein V2A67_12180 [Bacteroidota bacterium]
MNLQEAISKTVLPGIGELEALRLRIFLLEREFAGTSPDETTKIFLLHLELEKAYKAYMSCLVHRTEMKFLAKAV